MSYGHHPLVRPVFRHGVPLEIMAAVVSQAANQKVSLVGMQLVRRQLPHIEIVLQLAIHVFYGLPLVVEAEHLGGAVTSFKCCNYGVDSGLGSMG